MSGGSALFPIDFTDLPSTQIGSDIGFDCLVNEVEVLGRLQLFSKGSAINKGLICPGHWGIPESDDETTDLSESVDLVSIARRPKAIDLSDTEVMITNYDMQSTEFKRIINWSLQKDSGCMYGPSFLVFERTTGRFLEWFCGTKSTRAEAKKVYPYLGLTKKDIEVREMEDDGPHGPSPFTMNTQLVERKAYRWHVPVVVNCSTPFTNVPSREQIIHEMERFLNPEPGEIGFD